MVLLFYRRYSTSIGVSLVIQGVRKTFLEALMFKPGVYYMKESRKGVSECVANVKA